jgi:hypothetical protein
MLMKRMPKREEAEAAYGGDRSRNKFLCCNHQLFTLLPTTSVTLEQLYNTYGTSLMNGMGKRTTPANAFALDLLFAV